MPEGFDVDAARKAGYSDDEILSHLTSSRKFDIQGALASGYNKSDIIAHLASSPTMGIPQQTQPASPSLMQRISPYLPSAQTAAHVGGAAIGGAIGGIGGTVAGTPIGGIGGAAMGGAAGASIGESLYQLTKRALGHPDVPQTGSEAAQQQIGALLQGAAQEGIPAAINRILPSAIQKSASKQIAETVQPSTFGEQRNVQKIAGEAVQDFPLAGTRTSLLNKLSTKADIASKAVEDAYTSHQGTKFQSQPIADVLQGQIDKVSHAGEPIPGLEGKVSAYQQVIDWLKENPEFSIDDFRKTKQAWDSSLNYNRGGLGPDPAKVAALEDAANSVRDMIHSNMPDIAKADHNAHVWITLRDALSRADTKQFSKDALQGIVRRGTIPASIGGLAAYSEGKSPFEGAIIGGLIGQLTKTPAWSTLSIAEKAMLIKALQGTALPATIKGLSGMGSAALEEAIYRGYIADTVDKTKRALQQ